MHENEEWISIGDLMGGFVAVLILLLVASLLQTNYDPAQGAIDEIRNMVERNHLGNVVDVSKDGKYITLKDIVFTQSSACVDESMARNLDNGIADAIENFLKTEGSLVFIEGHADASAVHRQINDCKKWCGCYDDNRTLSALRARAIRERLTKNFSDEIKRKVAIAGFGDDRLLENYSHTDPQNRRVEIRFVTTANQNQIKW